MGLLSPDCIPGLPFATGRGSSEAMAGDVLGVPAGGAMPRKPWEKLFEALVVRPELEKLAGVRPTILNK
jgi:hypothetical protein